MDIQIRPVQSNRLLWLEAAERWWSSRPHRRLQVVLIACVLFISALIAQLLPVRYLPYPLAMIVALGALVIYLRTPPLGILVFMVAALLIRFEIGTNTGTSINFAVLVLPMLVGIWLADMVIRKRKIEFVRSRAIYPLLALALVSLLAFGIGQLPWFVYARAAPMKSQLAGLAIFIMSAAAFILVANLIKELRWLKWMTWLFFFLGGVYLSTGIIPAWGKLMLPVIPKGSGGSLLYVWLVALACSQLLFNKELTTPRRWLLIGLLACVFYVAVILSYDWKSGWVPALAVVGCLMLLKYPKFGLLLGIVALFFAGDLVGQIIASDEYSYSTRLIAWQIITTEIVKVNPILGLGPANYYYYTPLYPILGYSVEFNSHSNYIDILAQTGLLGLACFLWFALELGVIGLNLRKKVPEGFPKAYVYGVLGGLVGTLVSAGLGDWVIPFVYNIGLRGFRTSVNGWLFMGGLVVLEQLYRNHSSADKGL